MNNSAGPSEGSIEESFTALLELQQQGLIRHLGLSNVTQKQIEEGRRLGEVVCVQNHYNLACRADDAMIDTLASDGIAYVPFFPLTSRTCMAVASLAQHLVDPGNVVA